MIKKITAAFSIIGEVIEFLGKEKMWWLIPPVIILLLFGVLIMVSQGSALAPFVYPLF